MKHRFKNRVLSLVLSVCMMMPIMTQAMPVYSVDDEVETLGAFTTPFTEDTPIYIGASTEPVYSKSYRIPSMVTLNDGTIVAAADIRWNTTYDGGGLDTLVARSHDGGASWDYTLANYLGDNGNAYDAQSTTFIDPSLLVAQEDGKEVVYMLVDLYAYGVALNGPWTNNGMVPLFSYPSPDTGFNTAGFLKLTNDGTNYNYYLDGGSIWEEGASEPVSGYIVDAKFNITNTDTGETSNLFFETSPYRVARTQFLYLTKSEDGGASWSEPTLLNLRSGDGVEDALLVAPGNAIVAKDGTMVFPAYSYDYAPSGSSMSSSNQYMTLIYAKKNQNGELEWHRSPMFQSVKASSRDSVPEFSSEGAIVELADGTLRVFFRNKTAHMCYADFDIDTGAWIGMKELLDVPTNSDTQLSAITYSKTLDGKQVILVSCPTGPKEAGYNNGNGGFRTNGKIHVFTVNADDEDEKNSMTLINTVNLFTSAAQNELSGNYTEADGFFAYSALAERADGSIAILYENNQFGWGAGTAESPKYYTITGKDINLAEELLNTEARLDIPQLSGLINLKVRFLPEYQNETATVPYLYQTPGYQPTAFADVRVYDLPAVMKIADTYHTSADNVYFELVGDNGEDFPDEYYDHRWVSAEHLEAITINYTEAAPFGEPVVGQSMAVFARNAVMFAARNTTSNTADPDPQERDAAGVVTNKTVSSKDNDTYTVTLEAYVEGNRTIDIVTEQVPTDIVLVLDQSGSMATNDFKTIDGYQLTSGKANNYVNNDVYVKVGDEYVKVKVTPKYSYTRYQYSSNQNHTNYYIAQQANAGNIFYENGGVYYPVKVVVSNNYNNYTYYYTKNSEDIQIGTRQSGWDNRPGYNTFVFYQRTVTDHIFSYVDANGVTQSETFGSNANITTNKYYTTITSNITRLEALKNAVTGFVESVHEKAVGNPDNPDDDVNHRIAMVGFAHCYYDVSGDRNDYKYTNTELLIGSTRYGYNAYTQFGSANTNSAQSHYDEAFQNMDTEAGYNNVIASKNALQSGGGTYIDLGIEMANGIFEEYPILEGEKRTRVVVVFTDGDPGYSKNWEGGQDYGQDGDSKAVADEAIVEATETKSDYKATVYTVGIFTGADAETRPVDGLSNANKFMHYVSSNYQGGTSFDAPGDPSFPKSGSYYLSANNADDLAGIFQMISKSVEEGGASVTLDETTVVRDIVATNFEVPNGTTGVKFYTAQYTDEDTWGPRVDASGVIATIQNSVGNGPTTLDVTGFDFTENYVGTVVEEHEDGTTTTTYRGKKLIIEFDIDVDEDFLGGSGVHTNGTESGIYSKDDDNNLVLVEDFVKPKVDVPLKPISNVVQDKNIYVSNTTDLTGLLDLWCSVKNADGTTSNLWVDVDGINNAYVNLVYTIKLNDNTVAKYTVPAGKAFGAPECTWEYEEGTLVQNYLTYEDTPFTVTCVMTDAGNILEPSSTDGTASINVFYPVVTFKDVREKVPNESTVAYPSENYVSVAWKDNAGNAANNMEGTAPTLTYTYVPDAGCVGGNAVITSYEDFHVNVTSVKGNGQELISYVTFVHDNWDGSCGFDPNMGEFMIHMKKVLTSLTIQKSGWQDVDPNQSFLFRVTDVDDPSVELDLTVTVVGNGSTTITGLRVGKTYQVVEITDWSWRYTNKGVDSAYTTATVTTTVVANGAEVQLNAADADNVITFKNDRTNQYWLDGDSYCENWWGGNYGANLVKRNGQNVIVTEENS